jgi:hypothetical protein
LGVKATSSFCKRGPWKKNELWRPSHTINHGQPKRSRVKLCEVIFDAAASMTGGCGQNPFFTTKAPLANQTGLEVLRHLQAII